MACDIALIEPVGGHGGMNYYDLSLARGLVKNNHKIYWYTCDETVEPSENDIIINRFFHKIYGKDNKLIRLIRFMKGLLLSFVDIKKRRIKIVHYHFFHLSVPELLSVLLAKIFFIKSVVTLHDVESFSSKNNKLMARLVLSLPKVFIVHNQVSNVALKKVLDSFNIEKKIEIIPHGDYFGCIKNIDKKNARNSLGLSQDKKILLFFGQIKSVKGLDVLLNSLPDVIKNHPQVELVIAGKVWKADFSNYAALIESGCISNNVKLDIRYIPDGEADCYYCAADFVVLPYKQIYQSGVLLMAMSYGIPVIVSDLPGMTEIISSEINGFVFKTENERSLSDTISNALSADEIKLKKIIKNADNVLLSKHSWQNIASATSKVYESLNII